MTGKYLTAVICKNGHTITCTLELNPEENVEFCDECGESTIRNCEYCNEFIRGIFFSDLTDWSFHTPKYCHKCGKPYPWTERKLEVAIEYANEIENLNYEDKNVIIQSIDDIAKNSPKAEVSTLRYKKILKKVGGKIGEKLNDFIIDLASESIKKLLKE